MDFVSSLARDSFGQLRIRYSFCPRWHGVGLDNTNRDKFYVLAGMGDVFLMSSLACSDAFCVLARVWSTHVEEHDLSSLELDGFCQHILRCILCTRWRQKC
jgi:hypothetical protein